MTTGWLMRRLALALALLASVVATSTPPAAADVPSMTCGFTVNTIRGENNLQVSGEHLDAVAGAERFVVERRVDDKYWHRGTFTAAEGYLVDGSLPRHAVNVDYRIRAVDRSGATIAMADCELLDWAPIDERCQVTTQDDGSYVVSTPLASDFIVTRQVADGGRYRWRGQATDGRFEDASSPTGQVSYRIVERDENGLIDSMRPCTVDEASCAPYTQVNYGPPGWRIAGAFVHLADGSAYYPVVNDDGERRTARWMPHKQRSELIAGASEVVPQFVLPNRQHVVSTKSGRTWSLARIDGAGNSYPIRDWQNMAAPLTLELSTAVNGKVYGRIFGFGDPANGLYSFDIHTYEVESLGKVDMASVDLSGVPQPVDGRIFFTTRTPRLGLYGSELNYYDLGTNTVKRARRLEQAFTEATGGTVYNVAAGSNRTLIVSGYVGPGSVLAEIDVKTLAVRPIAEISEEGKSFELHRDRRGKALNEYADVYFNYSTYELGVNTGLYQKIDLDTLEVTALDTVLRSASAVQPTGYVGRYTDREDFRGVVYANYDTGEYRWHRAGTWNSISQAYDGTVLVSRNDLDWYSQDYSCD